MFWEEKQDSADFEVSDHVQDLHFSIRCRELPVDHLSALSQDILATVPWLKEIPEAGIHEIYLAGSQNGWEKPDAALGQMLILSRRTKLVIRVHKKHAQKLQDELKGVTLDISGHPMTLDTAKSKLLSSSDTISARHVAMDKAEAADENLFLERMAKELASMNIFPKKALCGKSSEIKTDSEIIHTRSLMLADLNPQESVKLQAQGLGAHRLIGCGLFLAMKGIQNISMD